MAIIMSGIIAPRIIHKPNGNTNLARLSEITVNAVHDNGTSNKMKP